MSWTDLIGGGIVKEIGNVADELFTSDEERIRAENERRKIEASIEKAAINADVRTVEAINRVNEAEARHSSIFVAGWRPAVGWIAAAALGFNFILQPLMVWGWALLQSQGVVPDEMSPPKALDISDLITLLIGMLGMGGLRTVEKVKRVARERLD